MFESTELTDPYNNCIYIHIFFKLSTLSYINAFATCYNSYVFYWT